MLFHIYVNLKVLNTKVSQFCVFHKTQDDFSLTPPFQCFLPKTQQQPVPYVVEIHHVPMSYLLLYFIQ